MDNKLLKTAPSLIISSAYVFPRCRKNVNKIDLFITYKIRSYGEDC